MNELLVLSLAPALRQIAWSDTMRQQKPTSAFRSIVCGIDFSRHSAMALRYAAALARGSRAHLVAIFAVDPFLSAAAAAAYDTRALASTALLELRRFVRATLGPGATGTLSCEVVVGKPARAIPAAAERLGADVVVVGTHGLSGVKKMFFGSTSDAILRRSRVPVLAIPRKCRAPRRNWPQAGVVAVVHFEDHAVQDAAAMSEAVAPFGVPMDLVVAVPNVRVPLWLRVSERAVNEHRVAVAQTWLDRRLEASSGLSTDTHVLVGDKADDIAAFAAGRGADLVLVTVPAARGMRRMVEGSTAYRLLCIAGCPVLVLPRREAGSHSAKPRPRLHDAA
jgi:nucleotide-binding universal stress UspA family protein